MPIDLDKAISQLDRGQFNAGDVSRFTVWCATVYKGKEYDLKKCYKSARWAWRKFADWKIRCDKQEIDYILVMFEHGNNIADSRRIKGVLIESEFNQFHPDPIELK